MKKLMSRIGIVLWLLWASASVCLADTSLAEQGAKIVHDDVMKLFDIIVTIVECVGAVLMLWSCFELGTGFQARDSHGALKGYKLLAASIVLILASVFYELLSP